MPSLPAIAIKAFLAWVNVDDPLSLSCEAHVPPEQENIRFSVIVGFGKDGTLTVLGPDGRPKLEFWNDVAPGEMAMGGNGEEVMVWTQVSSKRGTLVGFGVRSDGSVFSLVIPPGPQGKRPFTLFDSRGQMLVTGQCRG